MQADTQIGAVASLQELAGTLFTEWLARDQTYALQSTPEMATKARALARSIHIGRLFSRLLLHLPAQAVTTCYRLRVSLPQMLPRVHELLRLVALVRLLSPIQLQQYWDNWYPASVRVLFCSFHRLL